MVSPAAGGLKNLLMGTSWYRDWGKRMLDAIAAAVGLLLLSPLLIILAALVKITSLGPVFYRQERVGLGGRVFRIVKFRTMCQDADRRGPAITSAWDLRVTTAGRLLRRLKLDELPQLWNVLRGDMSLVGPRPEVPRYVLAYSPVQQRVLSVRPGITDPASIAYRREEELLAGHADLDRYYREVVLPGKLNMNLEYLDRMSFIYDLSMLVRTMVAIFIPLWTPKTQ
jgi:lipopolysaccharide/colanic/teichoic acid biosynthesis glycosyltransferase